MTTTSYGPITLRLWQSKAYEEKTANRHKKMFKLIRKENCNNELSFDYMTGKIKIMVRYNAGKCAVRQMLMALYW